MSASQQEWVRYENGIVAPDSVQQARNYLACITACDPESITDNRKLAELLSRTTVSIATVIANNQALPMLPPGSYAAENVQFTPQYHLENEHPVEDGSSHAFSVRANAIVGVVMAKSVQRGGVTLESKKIQLEPDTRIQQYMSKGKFAHFRGFYNACVTTHIEETKYQPFVRSADRPGFVGVLQELTGTVLELTHVQADSSE